MASPEDAVMDQPIASTELVRREVKAEVTRALDPEQLLASFKEYQQLCQKLLEPKDKQSAGKNDDGTPREFTKKSGWRKLATAFNLSVMIVSEQVTRDENDRPVRAKVIARAEAPNGRVMDGDGYCSIEEKRFKLSKGREKLEHDLPSTAATRAKNRAIADLIGAGEVSAEEINTADTDTPGVSGDEAADTVLIGKTLTAISFLLAGDQKAVDAAFAAVMSDQSGVVSRLSARAICLIAASVKQFERSQLGDVDPVIAEAEIVDEPPVQAAMEADRPLPGSVDVPDDLPDGPAARIKALRELGCICPDPMGKPLLEDCPLRGHGILF